jgi:hypothetical protein
MKNRLSFGLKVYILLLLVLVIVFAGIGAKTARAQFCNTFDGCCMSRCIPAGGCGVEMQCQVEDCSKLPYGLSCDYSPTTVTCVFPWATCVLTYCPKSYSFDCLYGP